MRSWRLILIATITTAFISVNHPTLANTTPVQPTSTAPRVANGVQNIQIPENSDVISGTVASPAAAQEVGALIRPTGDLQCSTILLGHRSALISGHCQGGDSLPGYKMEFGNWNRFKPEGTEQVSMITKVTPHPLYREADLNCDVAFVTLQDRIEFTGGIAPAIFTTTRPTIATRDIISASTYGYGITSPKGNLTSPVLKTAQAEVFLELREEGRCDEIMFRGLDGTMWNGDSGGPFKATWKGDLNHYVISENSYTRGYDPVNNFMWGPDLTEPSMLTWIYTQMIANGDEWQSPVVYSQNLFLPFMSN